VPLWRRLQRADRHKTLFWLALTKRSPRSPVGRRALPADLRLAVELVGVLEKRHDTRTPNGLTNIEASPGSARLRELNWCSDDAQAGYLEAPLCHSPNARARMGERRSATRASREKDSGSSVAPRAAPPSLRHRPPVSNETIGRSKDAAKGRGCWLRKPTPPLRIPVGCAA